MSYNREEESYELPGKKLTIGEMEELYARDGRVILDPKKVHYGGGPFGCAAFPVAVKVKKLTED